MVQFTKPDSVNKVWAASGDKATPADNKIAVGWQPEKPPRQYFNWLENRQDQMLAHINQFGIPEWDDKTEYVGGRSYVQASDGTVYKCLITNTGINPITDSSDNWIVAFDSASNVYTKAEADSLFIKTLPDGSTSQKGIVRLTNEVNVTSNTLAASATAVKTINDKVESNKGKLISGTATKAQADSTGVTITGDLRATGEVTSKYSDKRLKTDITPLSAALEAVLAMQGVRYRGNDVAKSFGFDTEDFEVGLLVQDVEERVPELVAPAPFDVDADGQSISGENYKTLRYERVVALLVEAIKEQQSQIEELQRRL